VTFPPLLKGGRGDFDSLPCPCSHLDYFFESDLASSREIAHYKIRSGPAACQGWPNFPHFKYL
jgi:hypothetical protein